MKPEEKEALKETLFIFAVVVGLLVAVGLLTALIMYGPGWLILAVGSAIVVALFVFMFMSTYHEILREKSRENRKKGE